MENAKMPTITPITPHITAFFALVNFPGSPLDVKNKKPATINIITATPINIGQIKLSIFSINGQKLLVPDIGVGSVGSAKADAIEGKITKQATASIINIFLFINAIIKLCVFDIPAPSRVSLDGVRYSYINNWHQHKSCWKSHKE